MASNTVEAAPAPAQRPPTEPQANPRGDQSWNRGDQRRGFVRGQQELQGAHDQRERPRQERNRGGQRRRGKQANNGSDRRAQPAPQVANNLKQPAPVLDPPPGLGGGGTFGGRSTKDATNAEGEVLTQGQDPDDEEAEDEGELCFICASPVVYHSIAPCNHQTCHICALRLRALYKTRACAHCRTEADHVIFTTDAHKRYEDFVESDFHETDHGLGIKYVEKEAHSDTLLLLRFNCPDSSCDVAAWGRPNLHRHVKIMHRRVMCDLCTRNKKVFTHEHELFTVAQLRNHEKYGDDNPGAVDQSGFKGHPGCGFCKERFYGDDELYAHCRDDHEKCHICERRNNLGQQQYYEDYDSLELHFRHDHFLCSDQECLDKKFVVFESEMDLKAHQLEVHSNDQSKDVRKDARRVNISIFDYRTPHQPTRGGRRERGRVVPRGRDPNTEPLPQSTAQPLRRDEIAFQRQLAIHSAQSVTSRTFGGQLTPSDPPAPRQNNRLLEPATVTANRNPPSWNQPSPPTLPTEPQSSAPPISETPQEQARRLQHSSVTNRASTLLKNGASKLSTFRSIVSSYRTSQLSASQLLDAFFGLFDCPPSELGKLIKELADLYEIDGKRESLLKAWNDWRAMNEDYPVLPGSSTTAPPPGGTSTAPRSGGNHILKLKFSTAQSSRSAVSKQGSWGNAAKSNPFPTMPHPPASSANRAGAGRVGPTPWVNPSPSSSSSASSRLTSSTRSPAPPSSSAGTDAFPALPAAARPNTLIAGLIKSTVRWDDARSGSSSATNNAWGSLGGVNTPKGQAQSPAASAAATAPAAGGEVSYEDQEEGGGNGKKKVGKGKKEVLYKFG